MNLLMCLIISLILLAVICLTIFLIVKYDKIDNDIDVIRYELREPSLHEIFVEKVGNVHEEE